MPNSQPGEDRRLDVLLKDYELARLDERSLTASQAAAFNVTVAVIALLAAGISQASPLPVPLLLGAPVLPLALLAYLQMLGTQATIRGYYLRGLEAEIRQQISAPLTALGDVPPTSLIELSMVIGSLRRGRLGYRILANLILIAIVVGFGGLTLYIGIELITDLRLRLTMLAVYLPITLLMLWETAAATVGGRGLYIRTAQQLLRDDPKARLPKVSRPTNPVRLGTTGQRKLFSYLLYPRPEDWVKVLFAPIVFACTAWSTGEWNDWRNFVLLWLIFEHLIYLARYQWNDVRGISEDAAHAERKSRSRLPLGRSRTETRRNVMISLLIALARLVAAVSIGAAFGVAQPVILLILLVFGIATQYEVLRARAAAQATKTGPLRRSWATMGIWATVSLGYAVRASLGIAFGGLALSSATAVIGMTCIAAYGAMLVLLTWVLEATSYCRHEVNGPKGLNAAWYRINELTRKPHIGALPAFVRKGPAVAPPDALLPEPVELDDPNYCGNYQILRRRGQIIAPWDVALALSAALAVELALRLSFPAAPDAGPHTVAVLLAAVGIGALVWAPSDRWRAVPVVSVTGALVLLALLAQSPHPLLAAVPWLVVSATYYFFRSSSYRDLKRFTPAALLPHLGFIAVLVGGCGRILARLVIGRESTEALRPSNPGR